jgi:hypothetical protein
MENFIMEKLPKIIAVDFDGCLVTNKYPEIGEPIEKNILKLKNEQKSGAKVILWTNRANEYLKQAVCFCEEHEIHLDAVNENLPEIINAFRGDTRKIFANEYWDDRAVLMSKDDTYSDEELRKNASGYPDPTAYEAIRNIDKAEEKKYRKLLYTIFDICELAGFKTSCPIIIIDKNTGKIWRE